MRTYRKIQKTYTRKNKTNKKPKISGKIIRQDQGWKIVYIHGDAYERGFAHGFLLQDDIKKSFRNFEFFLIHTFHTTLLEFTRTCTEKIKPGVLRDYPEFTEELRGICDGTNDPSCTFDKLLAWNSFLSLYDVFFKAKQTQSNPMQTPSQEKNETIQQRCAAFIATGDATKTGEIVMGHNTYCDFVSGYTSNIILYVAPTVGNGFPFVMQTMAGYISSTMDWFVCSTGIVGCETTISSVNYTPDFENGAPYFCRIRQAMQYAQTLDEYETIMTTRNAGDYACSWLFGDTKTGEIMILEIGLDHVSANRTNHGVYYGMNSAIDPLLRTAETTDQSLTDLKTSSGARNSRLHYLLLDKYYGRIDIPVGKKILADHYDPYLNRVEMGARSICAHTDLCPEGAHAYYPHGAIDCKLVDSTMARTLSFYAKWGPPCGRRFNATSFLKKHPEYKHFKPVLEDFPKREWTKITALS